LVLTGEGLRGLPVTVGRGWKEEAGRRKLEGGR